MPEKLTLDDTRLKGNTSFYKTNLLSRPAHDFYGLVRRADKCSNGILSPEAAAVCQSYETFFGVYKTLKECIGQNGLVNSDPDTKKFMYTSFSFYAAAVIGK